MLCCPLKHALATAALLILSPLAMPCATAQTAGEQQRLCRDDSTYPGDRVVACTSAMESGSIPASQLADLLGNRGEALQRSGKYTAAIADFDKAIGLAPGSAALYHWRGTIHFRNNKFAPAVADYDAAIGLDPKAAKYFSDRGEAHVSLGDRPRAIADFTRAIELDPGRPYVFYLRAQEYLADIKPREAAADASEAIRLNPKDPGYFLIRAGARSILGDKAGALADHDQAISVDPGNSWLVMQRGMFHIKQNDATAAIADFDLAIADGERVSASFGPGLPRGAPANYYQIRGNAYLVLKKDPARALADYSQAVRMRDDDPAYYASRAEAYAQLGRTAESAADLYRSGLLHLRSERWVQAYSDLDEAINRNPGALGAVYGRGIALLRLGETAKGQADIDRALAGMPGVAKQFADFGVTP